MTHTYATVADRYAPAEVEGFYEAGFWQRTALFDVVEAQTAARPDKTFVFDSTSGYTYRQLRDSALRLAYGLHRLGIRRGDRVAVQLPNWSEFVLCAVAIGRLGAVIVPIMPIYRDEEVGYILAHSGARAAITCEEFKKFRHIDMFSRLRPERAELTALIVVRGTGQAAPPDSSGVIQFADLLADAPAAAIARELGPAPSPDEPLLIVYTSGTTSRPKGCLHTFNTIRASAAAIAASLRYTDADVQFGPSPVGHGTGLVTSFVLPLITGGSSYLMESWNPDEGLRLIEKHGCTVAVTATTFLQTLMTALDPERHHPGSLRLWVCAGAPIPGAVVQRAGTVLPWCRVLSLYGRSENFLTTMCTVDDPPERSLTSDGSALAGATVAVVDGAGAPLPPGDEGDIAYKGPSHMLEYFRNAEHTAELFTPDGYSRSGDLGVMDADGFVRVTGRLKDIVIRGGLNISARELEDLLAGHPLLADAAVVAMPDERLGEKVCVYAVPVPGQRVPALADVTGYLRDHRLATPKLPERLEIVEKLPVTATGKVQKHILRADIAARLKHENSS